MKKQYLDYAGLKRVLKHLLPGARKIWHGTLDEWKALSEAERDKYDQAEVIDGSGYQSDSVSNLHVPDWSQAILLSVEVLTGGYKAPANGMIVGILYTHGTTSTGVSLTVNGVEVARNKAKDSDHILNVQCPVGKDDVIMISDEESQMNSAIRFVPYKSQ